MTQEYDPLDDDQDVESLIVPEVEMVIKTEVVRRRYIPCIRIVSITLLMFFTISMWYYDDTVNYTTTVSTDDTADYTDVSTDDTADIAARVGHMMHHHRDTCSERDLHHETLCCNEDLRCWGISFNKIEKMRSRYLYNFSNTIYEDTTRTRCQRYKSGIIPAIIVKYNMWGGNNSFISHDYATNITKCNEFGNNCCEITNICTNQSYFLAQTENCPDFQYLLYYYRSGYPAESMINLVISLLIVVMIFGCFCR